MTVARFASPDTATKAYTYVPALIAPGAAVMVVATPLRRSTKTLLSVYGLVPNRTYGAHAHQRPCGAAPTEQRRERVDTKPALTRRGGWISYCAR